MFIFLLFLYITDFSRFSHFSLLSSYSIDNACNSHFFFFSHSPPPNDQYPPITWIEGPLTRRNLFKHRLEEREHPEPWTLNFTSLGDSTDVASSHLPFDYLSSLRSPS